jgi:hypothetical protein
MEEIRALLLAEQNDQYSASHTKIPIIGQFRPYTAVTLIWVAGWTETQLKQDFQLYYKKFDQSYKINVNDLASVNGLNL